MISKGSFRTERPPSPLESSNRTVAHDEGGIKKKNHDADVPDRDTRIEQAETRTKQAEARTEQSTRCHPWGTTVPCCEWRWSI
jgi:hypothetical protein